MKVLIAEDDVTTRRLLEILLSQWGYETEVTDDGKEAWHALQATDPPQMAIFDWMMPEMNGVELCHKIRESITPSLIYIILLTVKDRKEDIVSGLDAGANDYVIKPFEQEELRARLRVGERVVELQSALNDRVKELQKALSHIKTLQGILPICMHCHKIRDDQDVWQRLEKYIAEHSGVQFSHGLCPECRKKYYPDPNIS
ncbi:MAG: response regulator [Deltaproteobacteria bacterium]|nr:response regulator [Deltaproteobacteria bacterium]MBW1719076.1 response regulator [Deltaproteobacteria bacterium]MBW1937973.1 response regulator [Deltaproteobacteria bacterium]MBW2351167.1 response regulator [Deltaproteobacteria bacterium]